MKRLQLAFSFFIVLSLLLVACGNAEENQHTNTNNNHTTENQDVSDDEVVLSLGESGVIEDTLGEYEITVESFEVFESYEDIFPINEDYIFLVIDLTVKNIGDTVLDADDILKPTIFDDNEFSSFRGLDHEFIDPIEGEIQPEEKVSGQILFELQESDYYNLIFGDTLEMVGNKVTWYFERSEAK